MVCDFHVMSKIIIICFYFMCLRQPNYSYGFQASHFSCHCYEKNIKISNILNCLNDNDKSQLYMVPKVVCNFLLLKNSDVNECCAHLRGDDENNRSHADLSRR